MAYSDKEWQEAKKKCKLNEAEIGMARQLGLNPRSLIKNIPSKSQRGKQPVGVWIREMYGERQEKQRRKQKALPSEDACEKEGMTEVIEDVCTDGAKYHEQVL